MTDTIQFRQSDGIAVLAFSNPQRHNALGQAELTAIERSLASLTTDTRVLLIHAQGDRTFCAGADLAQITSGELSGDRFQSVTNQIADLSVPTVALINGNVFGGGVELALSCDFRLGVVGTVMRIPAAQLGLCYPPDGIRRIVGRLGVPLAKRLLLAAEEFTVQDMLRHGLVSEVLSREAAVDGAMHFSRRISTMAPLAVRAMLEIIRAVERNDFDPERAAALAQACSQSEDLLEGLAARREKRAPWFTGR